MKYELSIVIPHYNSIELLEKLLKTIPKSNNIQVIIVDDHSSEDVIKKFFQLSSLFDSKNYLFLESSSPAHSAGAARNEGLKYVEGKWLLFADSDDYFIDGFYDILKGYFDSEYDVVFFTPTSILLDTGEKGSRHLGVKSYIDSYLNNPCHETELYLRTKFYYPWSKLIRTSLVENKNISFAELPVSNDQLFSVKVGYYAKKVFATKDTIYCVTRNSGSLTTKLDLGTFEVRIQAEMQVFDFLKQHLTLEDYKIVDKPVAYIYLYRILKRKYGVKVFFKYLKFFAKNHMLTFNFRWLTQGYLGKFKRERKEENQIRDRYQVK